MKQQVSDLLYLITPFACFDIEEVQGVETPTVKVTHYKPFTQAKMLQVMLGEDVKVIHEQSHDLFIPHEVSDGVVDGTVRGCLVAFREFLKANLDEHVDEGDREFSVCISENGQVSTSAAVFNSMQTMAILPSSIFAIMDLLSYRVPVFQALQAVSEDYTKFIEPDYYQLFIETCLGTFERKELFGSYAIKSNTLQGFVISFFSKLDDLKLPNTVSIPDEALGFQGDVDVSVDVVEMQED